MCDACADKAAIRSPSEGDPFWFDGGLMTIKTPSDASGGSLSLIDVMVPLGKATPLHLHPDAEESFYVIDGDITVHVDGLDHELTTGATTTVRRGTPHAFAVRSSTAHLLVVFTPGGGEQFFIEAGEPALRRELPPERPHDLDRYRAAAEKTGLVLLGPPPFDLTS